MLLLDRAYATAFAYAAYKSGDLKVREGSEHKIPSLEKAVRELFRPREAARRLRATLQLATIHDSVMLHSVPAGYHFTFGRLAREGVIAGVSGVGAISHDQRWPAGYTRRRFAHAIPPLARHARAVIRFYDRPAVQLFTTNVVRELCATIFEALDEHEINSGEALQTLYRSFYQVDLTPNVEAKAALQTAIRVTSKILDVDRMTVLRAVIVLLAEIMSALMLDAFSAAEHAPYVSDIHGRPASKPNSDELPRSDAYELCCIAMRDIAEYEPVIDSIDDMLRLRSDRRIVAFRSALSRWAAALQNGEVNVAQEIRQEVTRRNRELQSLSAWRRVDQWLYWSALPVAVVPIVSSIHTLVSVGVRWHIERAVNSNWLCLGR